MKLNHDIRSANHRIVQQCHRFSINRCTRKNRIRKFHGFREYIECDFFNGKGFHKTMTNSDVKELLEQLTGQLFHRQWMPRVSQIKLVFSLRWRQLTQKEQLGLFPRGVTKVGHISSATCFSEKSYPTKLWLFFPASWMPNVDWTSFGGVSKLCPIRSGATPILQ